MENIIQEIKEQYRNIEFELADPDVFNDQTRATALNKEYKKLKDQYDVALQLETAYQDLLDAKEMQQEKDQEFRQMGNEGALLANAQIKELETKLKDLVSPADPLDEKNVILEIRAAAGGAEAALFAQDLLRMYLRYAEKVGLKCELVSETPTDQGIKEAFVAIAGDKAYGQLKYENGVHRVQRVPKTETQGRIHTSTVSVVVRPEIEANEIHINESDLKVETMRSGGPGGQHANKVESAVRITHLPTGITASSSMKSQKQNREEALRVLRSRLYEAEIEKAQSELDQTRKSVIGTADRAEKTRTYNYAENRVTDHRVPVTLYKLDQILEGNLDEIIELARHKEREENLITS